MTESPILPRSAAIREDASVRQSVIADPAEPCGRTTLNRAAACSTPVPSADYRVRRSSANDTADPAATPADTTTSSSSSAPSASHETPSAPSAMHNPAPSRTTDPNAPDSSPSASPTQTTPNTSPASADPATTAKPATAGDRRHRGGTGQGHFIAALPGAFAARADSGNERHATSV
jgi:translation initiation factor IF-2